MKTRPYKSCGEFYEPIDPKKFFICEKGAYKRIVRGHGYETRERAERALKELEESNSIPGNECTVIERTE